MIKNILTLVLATVCTFGLHAQENEKSSKVINENQVKIGFSNQWDWMVNSNYDYYYDGGRYGYYYDETGWNVQPFIAYEHIWEFPNKVAVALEPKIGLSIKENITNGIAGLNSKFYWANRDTWRMGMVVYFGYGYANRDVSVAVPMDGGNYYEQKDVTLHFHRIGFDIGIIPFQFRLKSIPITIESQISLYGFSWVKGRSNNYEDEFANQDYYSGSSFIPYFVKGELKIGYVFPSK